MIAQEKMLVAVTQFEEAQILATIGAALTKLVLEDGTEVRDLTGWHQDDEMPVGGLGLYVWDVPVIVYPFSIDSAKGVWRSATLADLDEFQFARPKET